jgi:type IV secretion system protein VirD4
MTTDPIRIARRQRHAQAAYGFQRPRTRPDTGFETIPADAHTIVLGPTGAGKTTGALIPRLLTYPGPAIVNDPKGELFATTANARRRMGQTVYVVDPFGCTEADPIGLNPLSPLAALDDPEHGCIQIADRLFPDNGERDPFWRDMAAHLTAGIIRYVVEREKATGTPATLADVQDILGDGDPVYRLSQLLSLAKDWLDNALAERIGSVLSITDVTRSGIFSTALRGVRLFRSREIREAVSRTGLSLDDLVAGAPVTLYFCLRPSDLRTYGPVVRLWFDMLLDLLCERDTIHQLPTLFALDEAAALGRMPQVETAFSIGRGYGISLLTVFQTVHQARATYGPAHRVLFDNAGAVMAFPPANHASARDVAGLLGGVTAEALLQLGERELVLGRAGEVGRIVERYDVRFDPELQALADPNPRHDRPPAPHA